MKINSKALLLDAKEKGYAVPSTNFIDLDSARAYVRVAERLNLPLMLAYAESHKDIISLEEAAAIGNYLAKSSKAPVVLHLDHGENVDFIFKAIDLGFSSVMIDASQLPFDENVAISKKVADYAHKFGVTVEAELGHVGANENFENHDETDSVYTEAKDVLDFVNQTGVDSLAISIGTAHGNYKGTPKINFERLQEIHDLTNVPLVLHGGSSSGDDNLNRCATNGISKINIFTDFLNRAHEEVLAANTRDYLELKVAANKGMEKVIEHYFEVFNTQPFEI